MRVEMEVPVPAPAVMLSTILSNLSAEIGSPEVTRRPGRDNFFLFCWWPVLLGHVEGNNIAFQRWGMVPR